MKRLDALLFGPEAPRRLAIVHAGLVAALCVRVVAGPYREIAATTPDGLFRPPWFLAFLDSMPPVGVVMAAQVVAVVATVAWFARRCPRAAFVTLWCCYLFVAAIRDARGKILHNDVLALLVTIPFLAAPIGDLADRRPSTRTGWPLRAGCSIIALAYFFAGYHKVVRSGLEWITSDNVRHAIAWGPKPAVGRWEGLADLVTAHWLPGRIMAAGTIAFELGFLAFAFVPRLRPVLAAVATTLHIATTLLFGLDYAMWIVVLWLFALPWERYAFVDRFVRSPNARVGDGTVGFRADHVGALEE